MEESEGSIKGENAAAFIWLSFSIRRLRKLDKGMEAQASVYLEELSKNNAEISPLQNEYTY
jgi:hypothetical protein